MRKSISAALVLSFISGVAMATPEVVVSCATQQGEKLEVSFDKATDDLSISYGQNLGSPEYHAVKKTNDMFWNSEYNSSQKIKDTVMYLLQGDEQAKFSVTDYGDHTLVMIAVDNSGTPVLEDACRDITQFNFNDQLTANMAWVDDN